jgi:hypothetical protein
VPSDTGKTANKNAAYPAVLAGFLGWTLDSFDFFVVVFLIDRLEHQFGVSVISWPSGRMESK